MAKNLDAQAKRMPDRLQQQQQAQMVHAEIAKLPAKQRDAILLYYLGGLDQAAVGERLGCSPKAVQKRVEYALAALRTNLAGRTPASQLGVAIAALDQIRNLHIPAGLVGRCHEAALSGTAGKSLAAVQIANQVTRAATMKTWTSVAAAVVVAGLAVAATLLYLPHLTAAARVSPVVVAPVEALERSVPVTVPVMPAMRPPAADPLAILPAPEAPLAWGSGGTSADSLANVNSPAADDSGVKAVVPPAQTAPATNLGPIKLELRLAPATSSPDDPESAKPTYIYRAR